MSGRHSHGGAGPSQRSSASWFVAIDDARFNEVHAARYNGRSAGRGHDRPQTAYVTVPSAYQRSIRAGTVFEAEWDDARRRYVATRVVRYVAHDRLRVSGALTAHGSQENESPACIAVRAVILRDNDEHLCLPARSSHEFIVLKFALQKWMERRRDPDYVAEVLAYIRENAHRFTPRDVAFLRSQKRWNSKDSDDLIFHRDEQQDDKVSDTINTDIHSAVAALPADLQPSGRPYRMLPGGTDKGTAAEQMINELVDELGVDNLSENERLRFWSERVDAAQQMCVFHGHHLYTRVYVIRVDRSTELRGIATESNGTEWVRIARDVVDVDDTPKFHLPPRDHRDDGDDRGSGGGRGAMSV